MSFSDRIRAALGDKDPRALACSFCGKTQDQVRKLIAGPSVYICDECIDLCDEVMVGEVERGERSRVPLDPTPVCRLCHLPRDVSEMIMIPELGPLCAVCMEAIRRVIDDPER